MASDGFLELKTYVLYTEGGKEQHLADLLTNTILEIHPEAAKRAYVPLRAYLKDVKKDGEKVWIEKKVLLFSNYVFVESNNIELFNTFLYTPGFDTGYNLLGKGTSRLRKRSTKKTSGKVVNPKIPGGDDYDIYPVSEDDMKRLRMLMGEDDFVDVSRGIKENGRVRFTSGPLVGLDPGKIIRIDRHKRFATVQMQFMGDLRKIDVAIEVLSAVDDGDAS